MSRHENFRPPKTPYKTRVFFSLDSAVNVEHWPVSSVVPTEIRVCLIVPLEDVGIRPRSEAARLASSVPVSAWSTFARLRSSGESFRPPGRVPTLQLHVIAPRRRSRCLRSGADGRNFVFLSRSPWDPLRAGVQNCVMLCVQQVSFPNQVFSAF